MRNDLRLILIAMAIPFAVLVGCSEQGPAETAGEKIDEAVEDVKDAVDPAGPAEKVGEKIDDAVEGATN